MMENVYGSPDTLQDLCLLYCMNNLEVLTASLRAWQTQSNTVDNSATFPVTVGNNMLRCFLTWGVYLKKEELEDLLKNCVLCNEVNIQRRLLSLDSLKSVVQHPMRHFGLSVFSSDIRHKSFCDCLLGFLPDDVHNCLIERSPHSLISLKLFITWNCDNIAMNIANEKDQSKKRGECSGGPLSLLKQIVGKSKKQNVCRSKTLKPWEQDLRCFDFDIRRPPRQQQQQPLQPQQPSQSANSDSSDGEEADRIECGNNFTQLSSFSVTLEITWINLDYAIDTHSRVQRFISANPQLKFICVVSSQIHPLYSFCNPVLRSFQSLQSLILSFSSTRKSPRVSNTGKYFQCLAHLKQLRHLDLSYGGPINDVYCFSDESVMTILEALRQMPQLVSLEVAGTNLDQMVLNCQYFANRQTQAQDDGEACPILGQPPLNPQKFQYLGLFGCHASEKHNCWEAKKISGSGTEEQLLVALWTYTHNKAIMASVLHHLRFRIQHLTVTNPQAFIEGLVNLSGSLLEWDNTGPFIPEFNLIEEFQTCLYLLVRQDSCHIPLKIKRTLLQYLLVVLTNCLRDMCSPVSNVARMSTVLMIKLDVLNLCVYMHQFENFVQVMMDTVGHEESKKSLKEIALKILHELCRISQHHKKVAGCDMKLVQFLLSSIDGMRKKNNDLDELIEKQWSILWTLTDEVASNCQEFLRASGVKMVEDGLAEYSDYTPMCRKITGAMSNVSENAHLRPQLMTPEIIQLFREYLKYEDETDYDVSSHAASFLVLLAADGPAAWTVSSPTRQEILDEVDALISKWDINKSKGVKFRSLQPMLLQIQNQETPVAQYWGAWVIENLVIVRANRYCQMVKDEGGVEIITAVLEDDQLRPDVRSLLLDILDRTERYLDSRAPL